MKRLLRLGAVTLIMATWLQSHTLNLKKCAGLTEACIIFFINIILSHHFIDYLWNYTELFLHENVAIVLLYD